MKHWIAALGLALLASACVSVSDTRVAASASCTRSDCARWHGMGAR